MQALSFLLIHKTELVKVVNVSGTLYIWLLAIRRLECKALSNQNVGYLYLPSLDLVQRESAVFWNISLGALYTTKQHLYLVVFPNVNL